MIASYPAGRRWANGRGLSRRGHQENRDLSDGVVFVRAPRNRKSRKKEEERGRSHSSWDLRKMSVVEGSRKFDATASVRYNNIRRNTNRL